MMYFLFAMIAFVTNLCSPMAIIVKNQFGASNAASQLGNTANFIAYLVMGIPSGFILKQIGYKRTALLAILIGIAGVFIQYMSGWKEIESFWVYLIGAFISGLTMCMLNTVVNPLLNSLGGGGNRGNQLVQFGGVCSSISAVAVTIIMGSLIGDAAKAHISDATPALFIAMGVFAIAFVGLLFTRIEEPQEAHDEQKTSATSGKRYSAFSFRHFNLGILAIFLYMGLEVGPPTYILQFLTADKHEMKTAKVEVLQHYESQSDPKLMTAHQAASAYVALTTNLQQGSQAYATEVNQQIAEVEQKIAKKDMTSATLSKAVPGIGMNAGIAGTLVAVYWLLMLVGRLLGGVVGGKVSSRAQVTTASLASIVLLLLGMLLPESITVRIPGIDWSTLSVISAQAPIGIFCFILIGLFTSIMWGGIFNMAVEGLGKYIKIASGAFMTMVFGCAILIPLQGWVADLSGSYIVSFSCVIVCAAYILFYALIGSKNVNKDIPTD